MPNEIVIQAPAAGLMRGETIVVLITLKLETRLKARGIHARFWGAEEAKATYTTTSTDSNGNSTTETHTAVEHVHIVDQQRVLAGNERLGFFRGLLDAAATAVGGGQHTVMEPGEYPLEFEMTLPEGAPGTYKGKNSRIFYELSAWVDIPLAIDLKAKHSFEIPSLPVPEPTSQPVRVSYPGDAGKGLWDSMLGPDIRIELALASDVARQGETIEAIVVTECDKPLAVQALWVSLVGVEHTQAQGHQDNAHYAGQRVQICGPRSLQGSFSQTFSLPCNAAGPPTLCGSRFSVDWFVQVELDVPWAKDPKIRAPIRILSA